MPPDSSKYGQNNEQVLNALTFDLYKYAEVEDIFLCGDFNARIGNLNECESDSSIPQRTVIDNSINQQGQKLMNFCSDLDLHVLNGRVMPELNDYTSLTSYRGRAVVDYNITRTSNVANVKKVKVHSCTELVARMGIESMLSNNCHIPDHNLIEVQIEMSMIVRENLYDKNLGAINVRRIKTQRKFGNSYMKSDVACRMLPAIIEWLETTQGNQNEINSYYEQITNLLVSEANNSMTTVTRKRAKIKYKP